MKKKHTPGITARFLQVCDELTGDGTVKNKSVFTKSIGEHQQNISLMEKGVRAPTIEHIANVCELYGYSAHWLITGTGDKKSKPRESKSIDQRVNDLESIVAQLKRKIK